MQITNGLLETNVLATIRRSLQERYKSDEHLKKLLLEIQEKNMIFCGFYLWFFVGLNITMIATILPELKEKK